MVTFSQS